MSYDPENIFAKILKGEIPSTKIYEDDDTYVFMDIMPRAPGHMLVIPKTPCRNMLDATPEQMTACLKTAQKVAHAALKGLGAGGITVQQFNEAIGGQEVFHLHYHIIPRLEGERMGPPGVMGDMEEIKAVAERIRAAL